MDRGRLTRAVPLALAYRGDDLIEATRISGLVTHAHPNAVEAAIAGAWLVRAILETGRWDVSLVEEAIRGLDGPWFRGGEVAASLVRPSRGRSAGRIGSTRRLCRPATAVALR
jgi:ADP-ribosylglycohydrolase